jgi:hypothetical protein
MPSRVNLPKIMQPCKTSWSTSLVVVISAATGLLPGTVASMSSLNDTNPAATGSTGTLAYDAYHEIKTLASSQGADCVFAFKTNGFFALPNPLNPHFYLLGCKNILASGLCQPDGSNPSAWAIQAVSPRHCLYAWHTWTTYAPRTNLWFLRGGGVYTNWTMATAHITNTDIAVTLMAKTNPCYYRVWCNAADSFVESNDANEVTVVVGHYASTSGNVTTWTTGSFVGSNTMANGFVGLGTYPTAATLSNRVCAFGDYATYPDGVWHVGDSSSPMWVILHGEAVLVTEATFPTGGAYLDPNLINPAMAWLSTNNSAPVYTLTSYPFAATFARPRTGAKSP